MWAALPRSVTLKEKEGEIARGRIESRGRAVVVF